MPPELIYCAKKNYFAPIALAAGFRYGAQLPNSVYQAPYFADQNWKRPRAAAYLAALERFRPALATVLDLEHPSQLDTVLLWAHLASAFVSEAIIVIPKYIGAIDALPRAVNGVPIRLGYSVLTTHGGTDVPEAHFLGWQVHLLGGNPLKQYELATPHFDAEGRWIDLDVRSIDCNYIQLKAVKWVQFLDWALLPRQNNLYASRPALRWLQLKDVGLGHLKNAPYEAFRRSCSALASLWALERVAS